MTSNQFKYDLLLILPVPFLLENDRIFFESQACLGLSQWVKNFNRVVVACPVVPKELEKKYHSTIWKPVDEIDFKGTVKFIPLPWAYTIPSYTRNYFSTKSLLKQLIQESEILHFSPFGLIGDWASLGAQISLKLKRKYSLHFDCIIHQVFNGNYRSKPIIKQLYGKIICPLMKLYNTYFVKHSTIVLCNGKDTHQFYSKFNKNSFLIHDIHTNQNHLINPAEIKEKINNLNHNTPLKLIYTGRMSEIKGPMDWIQAIHIAHKQGALIEAFWYGEGPMRTKMEKQIHRLHLQNIIHLCGFLDNLEDVLSEIKKADLFLMTHLYPESPRCIKESLVSGTPILGYWSQFAEDVIQNNQGGYLTQKNNIEQLGEKIAEIAANRKVLKPLITQAAKLGERFTEDQVFLERSHILKKHLNTSAT